jgi:hypothetical protein
VRLRCRPSTRSFWGDQMQLTVPRCHTIQRQRGCQIVRIHLGFRRPFFRGEAAAGRVCGGGRCGHGCRRSCGDRLPVWGIGCRFGRQRLPDRSGAVTDAVAAADVVCRAADVRSNSRRTLRRRAQRPPIASLTATAPPVGFAQATAVLRISSSNPMRSSTCAGAKTPSGPCGFKSVKGDS